jgi:hypothetical protein
MAAITAAVGRRMAASFLGDRTFVLGYTTPAAMSHASFSGVPPTIYTVMAIT